MTILAPDQSAPFTCQKALRAVAPAPDSGTGAKGSQMVKRGWKKFKKVRFTFLRGRADKVGPHPLPNPKAGRQKRIRQTCHRRAIKDSQLS